MIERVAHELLRIASRLLVRNRMDVCAEGLSLVPRQGPVLIVAHHYHHLYDGALMAAYIPRTLHIVVALDWVKSIAVRRIMEKACRTVKWPVILRDVRLGGAYEEAERRLVLRRGLNESVEVLSLGHVLVIFPEGYPNEDPLYTPKIGRELLHFRSGFATILKRAASAGPIAIVPLGFRYQDPIDGRRAITMRFGEPLWYDGQTKRSAFLAQIEADVRRLSGQ